MIKVLLWDIDGTILNFKIAERNSLRACFDEFGLGECSDETVAQYSAINQSYWERLELGELTKAQVLLNRFADFLEVNGITSVEAQDFCNLYEKKVGETIEFIDDCYELLKMLQGDYKQYAVTNGALAVQQKKLKDSGLCEIFDGVFISDEVGYEKPNKLFFDFVLENIEPVDRDEILVIGDSLTSDIKGGNNAGIKTCWYNPFELTNDKDVRTDYEIQNLNQIVDVLKN
jgi:2-haloacid dehalogenase